MPSSSTDALQELIDVVSRLRDPDGGCPWDLEQTHASLVPYVLEEAHEVADAIRHGDEAHLKEELGDLLLQVVLHDFSLFFPLGRIVVRLGLLDAGQELLVPLVDRLQSLDTVRVIQAFAELPAFVVHVDAVVLHDPRHLFQQHAVLTFY